jgi:DNA-binding response OmpR family regulator
MTICARRSSSMNSLRAFAPCCAGRMRRLASKIIVGYVAFDTSDRQVTVDGIPVEFGRRELDGLELLMRRTVR